MLKKALYNIDHIDDLNREINEKAREGYELLWIGIFMHFGKSEKASKIRYRAEPCGMFNSELAELYTQAGWQVLKYRFRGITVFKTEDPKAEPVLTGEKRAEAVWFGKVKSCILALAVSVLLLYMALMPLQLGMHDGDYSYLFDSFALFETVLFACFAIWCAIQLCMTFMRKASYLSQKKFVKTGRSSEIGSGIIALLIVTAALFAAYNSTLYLWRLPEYLFVLFIIVWMMHHETTMAFMIINFLLAGSCLLVNRFHKEADFQTLTPADYGETAFPDEEEKRYAHNILGTCYEVSCPQKYLIECYETNETISEWIFNREMNRYNSRWAEVDEEEWLADEAAYAEDHKTYLLKYGNTIYRLFDERLQSAESKRNFGRLQKTE